MFYEVNRVASSSSVRPASGSRHVPRPYLRREHSDNEVDEMRRQSTDVDIRNDLGKKESLQLLSLSHIGCVGYCSATADELPYTIRARHTAPITLQLIIASTYHLGTLQPQTGSASRVTTSLTEPWLINNCKAGLGATVCSTGNQQSSAHGQTDGLVYRHGVYTKEPLISGHDCGDESVSPE